MTDTDTDTRVLRFRRPPFREFDNQPRWHIAARNYDTRLYYNTVVAECGYEAHGMNALTVSWSRAKPENKPPGPHCISCAKAMQS